MTEKLKKAKVVIIAGQYVCTNCACKLKPIDINLGVCYDCNSLLKGFSKKSNSSRSVGWMNCD